MRDFTACSINKSLTNSRPFSEMIAEMNASFSLDWEWGVDGAEEMVGRKRRRRRRRGAMGFGRREMDGGRDFSARARVCDEGSGRGER